MSSDNVSCCRSPNCLLKFVVLGTCYAPGSRSQATATSGLGCAGDLCGSCLHMAPCSGVHANRQTDMFEFINLFAVT